MHREMDADAGDEHLAAAGGRQQVARAGDRERGEQQAVDQRLDEPQERQVEQEERRCRGRRPGP